VIFITCSFRESKSTVENGKNLFRYVTRKIRPESIRQHHAGVFASKRVLVFKGFMAKKTAPVFHRILPL
jgi:hypothetical protein